MSIINNIYVSECTGKKPISTLTLNMTIGYNCILYVTAHLKVLSAKVLHMGYKAKTF